MLNKNLGTWQIAGSDDCTATLDFDWRRSVTISLQWSCEPGPVEHEHLAVLLQDILKSALDSLGESAAMFERVLDAIAKGRICRSGVEDEVFTYEAIDRDPAQEDT
jgi:hypothetical protein